MSRADTTLAKIRRRTYGLVFLLIAAFLVWLSIAFYEKKFSGDAIVTLYASSVGNEMHPQADVKMLGVVVGEVRKVASDGRAARLTLAMKPGMLHEIPSNVAALMMPTTLFGERYVSLIAPPFPSADRLGNGSVIRQDSSRDAIELQEAWDNLLPTLQAVQPEKLSTTLSSIRLALQGRGTKIGTTLRDVNSYLGQFNPHLPDVDADIAALVRVTRAYQQAAPGLLDTLNNFSVTGQTLQDRSTALNRLYSTVTGTAGDLTTFLRENQGNMIQLAAHSRPTLRLLAKYSPEFPCTLRMLTDFEPNMDRTLGKGTDEPGLHVTLHVRPSRGRYLPGTDTPRYDSRGGPRCYSVPFQGAPLNNGTTPAHPSAAKTTALVATGLGPPNSPQENELVNELMAPALGVSRTALPDWSTVLTGPLYRGTEVRLK
ncbi:MAG TPA: MCE family protein [Streptosporangiaceae bacterium]|jgi:phospholipid/cholesterol/gamma-HCH transport system substrate-binding protein